MYNQIYNISNDFVKFLTADKNYSFLVKNWNGKRGPKRRLSIEKVTAQWAVSITMIQTAKSALSIPKTNKTRTALYQILLEELHNAAFD